MKILFETLSGSKLYGTNSENSDTDIKGIFLPDIEDLILNRASKTITESTGKDNEKNSKEDIDKTYYSLQYFLELVSKGETNCVDLLFASSNKGAVIKTTPEFEELLQNKDKIITSNINSYLGYCKSQCMKYSLKGEKLENYNKFKSILEEYINKNIKDKNGMWITLRNLLIKKYGIHSIATIIDYSDYKKGNKITGKRAHFLKDVFGEHSYILETLNGNETYLMISDVFFNFEDSIMDNLRKVNKVIASYGKRAEIASQNNGSDYKAISHCVRVLKEVEELLLYNKITFPLKDAEFIKSIKYNTTLLTRDEIMDFIDKKIYEIENVLLPNSKLRNKADTKFIDNFILKQYKENKID